MKPVLGLWAAVVSLQAVAQAPEVAVLGQPCLPENPSDIAAIERWHALVRRHGEVERRGERIAALDLARQIVRSQCSSEYWWLKLAEELFDLGRADESLAALEALYGRKSNAVDRALGSPESPFNRLRETDAYRRSALAAKLAADREALEQRRREARARMAAEPRPPERYVAKHACPFECCRFGEWVVRRDTILYDHPGGSSVVVRVRQGDRVEALTGEVHLRPLPVRVRFRSPYGVSAEEGTVVYLLDYLGEGHGRVWANGRIMESEILSVHEHCTFPGPDCWGEFVNPEDAGRQRDGVWWVQIRTRQGLIGWTREIGHFGGMDGCR